MYRRLCTCETLCERSSGMSFICVVIGLECRVGLDSLVRMA